MTHPLYLAVDSGGTKSRWIALSKNGCIIDSFVNRGMASVRPGMLPTMEIAQEAAKHFGVSPAGIYFSLGGPNVDEIRSAMSAAFPNVPFVLEREASGDLVFSLRSFLKCDAVVMVGTGITAVGFWQDGRRYAEGWGPLFADFGSGGGIGFRAVQHFLREIDNLEPSKDMLPLFAAQLDGLDVAFFQNRMALKNRINALTRRELAALAPEVAKLASSGNQTAAEIIGECARKIAEVVAAVTPPDGKCLAMGGLMKLGPSFVSQCADALLGLNAHCRFAYDEKLSLERLASIRVLMEAGVKINEDIWNKVIK